MKDPNIFEILLLLAVGFNEAASGPSYITGLGVVLIAANKMIIARSSK